MARYHPCGGCSREGTIPEYIPELGITVYRCEACDARERERKASLPHGSLA